MTRTEITKLHKKIADYIERHPEQTYTQMSSYLSISVPSLSKIAIKYGIRRGENTYQPHKRNIEDLNAKLEN